MLVVDDEPLNRELIRDALEARGHAVEEAAGGTEALDHIAAAPPDVVLLDVAMPGKDGIEVCRRLRADPATAALPVVMVTAHAERNDRLAGIAVGANDYLTKPVDMEDLALRVRNTVHTKLLYDDLRDALRQVRELEQLRDGLTHLVVHDLRSPLTAILTSLELLGMSEAAIGPEDREDVRTALRAAQTMRAMVSSLLDISRFESGQMPLRATDCDLEDVACAGWER